MRRIIADISDMRSFLLLWATQSFSALGSALTSYALVIWTYTQKGSALVTALLMISSYAPYVLCSIFAGALIDKWNKKKIMLFCDLFAAVSTVIVLILLKTDNLLIWHLYVINVFSGLMNTVQQPASEVATTVLLPRKHYQKVGGLKYFSNSLNSILTPVIATVILSFAGIEAVIIIDLLSFLLAAVTLLFFIPIPEMLVTIDNKESLFYSAKQGLNYLKCELGILHLMLFLAAINFVSSMFNAALPALLLSKHHAGEYALGVVNTVTGVTTLVGSIIASFLKAPKNRVRRIWWCLMISMSTENFILGFSDTLSMWCLGAFLGWILIPLMSTNLEAVYRLTIPEEIHGRFFAVRNSLQFFTIPLGYFVGGFLVDKVFEPVMATQSNDSMLSFLFGTGKGSGAAFFFAVIGLVGVCVCLYFRFDKHIQKLETEQKLL